MRNPYPLLALSFAASLAAQATIVIPPSLTNAPGWSSTGHPLGFTVPGRVQYCWDASETGLSLPTMLKSMEMRAEEGSMNVAKTLTMAIEMSTTAQTANALTTTFATNRGPNHAIVFTAKPINLPATPTGGFVGMWTPAMVYDTPFLYVPAAGNLLCEFDVSAAGATNYTLDISYTANGHHFSVGAPCSTYAASSTGGGLGATLTYSCSAGTANAPAALVIGATEFPVPMTLPGNPACKLLAALDVVLPMPLSGTGTGSVVLSVPNMKPLRGVSIFGQWVQLKPTMILESSYERRVVLGDVYLVSRVSNTTSNTALTGTFQASVGLIMRFGI